MIRALAFDPGGARLAVVADSPTVEIRDLPGLRRELAALGLDWGL